MLISVADDTVTVVDPVTLVAACVALIVAVPPFTGVTSPLEPDALLMVAMDLFADFQVTWVVRSWLEPSEKLPVAVYCTGAPTAIVAVPGVIVMDMRVAAVTVSVVVFVTDPSAAVIVVEPTVIAVASPLEPAVLLIVATALFDEVHTTDAVMSWVVPSLNVPVAVNCSVVPIAIWAATGDMLIDVSVAGVTVRVDNPNTPSNHAVMIVVPDATGMANPLEPAALLIVATPVFDEVQVTSGVRS